MYDRASGLLQLQPNFSSGDQIFAKGTVGLVMTEKEINAEIC
jgi:hypothetical protein